MRVSKSIQESLLAGIIRGVQQSLSARLAVQDLADKISSFFVPTVIVIAIFTFIIWYVIGNPNIALTNAISVLIIACPCALGLATPLSIFVATGIGAQNGILIRNARTVQKLEKVDVVAIDKTGTLTKGQPRITAISHIPEISEDELLLFAASIEQGSEHPLAKAVLKKASERKLNLLPAINFVYEIGLGLSATVNSKNVLIGKEDFLKNHGVDTSNLNEIVHNNLFIVTPIFIAIDGLAKGIFWIEDEIREKAKETIETLKKLNVQLVMLTGDKLGTARKIAQRLYIDRYFAELLPQDKAKIVCDLKAKGHLVAAAGDGINDALALGEADVGIAMGEGSGAALETADIIIMHNDLSAIVKSIKLSRAMMGNIRQNLALAFLYNVLAIPIAAGVLSPKFGISLSPAIASIAMILSSLSVIANSLRLKTLKL